MGLLATAPSGAEGRLVEQSSPYLMVRLGASESVTCTLKDTTYPWMSWYLQDAQGQMHFLESLRSKDADGDMELLQLLSLLMGLLATALSGWAVRQPPDMVVSQGQPLTLNCSQKSTRYTSMYWYKQAVGKDARLQLVMFSIESFNATVEKPFERWAVRQPPDMVVSQGQPLTLNCSQKSTRYTYMYWYKQAVGKDARLQLVVFSMEGSGGTVEKPFEGYFQSNRTENIVLSLSAERAQVQDSGTYYCAKQDHTVTQLQKVLSINLPAKGKDFPSPTPMYSPASCIRCAPSCSNTSLPCPYVSSSPFPIFSSASLLLFF
ncbi:T-cell receptor beta chain V region E1 [Chelonia mydas]|nr:T-cell receptor beta chain V region E1 [Chelonia mydas]